MSDTPQYQQVMDIIGGIIAAEQANPGSIDPQKLRDMAVMVKTVMPNLTAADIAALSARHITALDTHKATLEQDLSTHGTAKKTEITDASDAQIQAIADALQLALDDVVSERDQAIAAINIGDPNVAGGMIVADFRRYAHYGNFAYTSELPQIYNSAHMKRLFEILVKNQDPENPTRVIRHSHIPKTLLPISDDAYACGISKDYTEYASTSHRYNYPTFNIAVMFIKNTTNAPITRDLSFFYSSYWGSGYEGAQLFTVIPDAEGADLTDVTYTQVWNVTSSHASNTSASITIPANTTIAVVLACSEYYHASSSGYQFSKEIGFFDLPDFLSNGLEIDIPVTQAALTKNMASDISPWALA